MTKNSLKNIRDITLDELKQFLDSNSLPKFRFSQIVKWLYEKEVQSFDEMKNIPSAIKDSLAENFSINTLKVKYQLESTIDSTVKFGLETIDGKIIESVILVDGKRRTLCVSSQVGCALGCVFCETGKMGFIRDLTPSEILNQIICANSFLTKKNDKKITNLVFMGMGEALFNFENFVNAINIITDENCFAIGGRKITVSTAGVIPSIKKLQDSNLNIGLAISLNSFNDEERDRVMPINKKYPIKELINAADFFSKEKNRRVTFEYVVINNSNETKDAANELIKLLKGKPFKINLIPINPYTENSLKPPTNMRLNIFAEQLTNAGLTVTIRKSHGQDISGACGQLAGKNS